MGSRISSFIQSQFQAPTSPLPTPTFTCLPSGHRRRCLPSLNLSKTSKAAVFLIITNETLEKMCSIGATSILQNFLTKAFNLSINDATSIVLLFSGFANFVPVLGAVLSDTFFGRFKTLCFSTPCSLVGVMLLTATALPRMHPSGINPAEAWQKAVLYASLFFFTMAAAGIRSCSLPFGIDQYDLTTEAGRRGKEKFIAWNYASFTLSVLAAVVVIPAVQEATKKWVLGFVIPASLMLLSCVLFFAGGPLYVKAKPEGSPVVSVLRVFVASFRNRRLPLPADPSQLFSHPTAAANDVVSPTNRLRFLERAAIIPAAIINAGGGEEEAGGEITAVTASAAEYQKQQPWKLCSREEVEDAKAVVKVMVMWTPSIIYQMVAAELQSHVYPQAAAMDRKMGRRSKLKFPASSTGIFSALALTAWVALYDKVIIPRRNNGRHGEMSTLQRMGIGMFMSILAAAVAGTVEGRRRRRTAAMSVFWLVPQLVLAGLAEGFHNVAQIEFFHTELPATVASLTGALFAMGYSFGSFASWALDHVVERVTRSSANPSSWLADKNINEGKLDYHYFLLTGLAAANTVFFLFLAVRRQPAVAV